MVIYLTLKFAFGSLGGFEIEFPAFIISICPLIGWFVASRRLHISLSSIEKKTVHQGIDPQPLCLLDESATIELSELVIQFLIEIVCI